MSTLARTPDGDVALTTVNNKKRITIVTDPSQATAIKLADRFSLWRGEWFLDTREGVPYLQTVFRKNPDLNAIRSLFRFVILTTPGIVRVDDLTLDYDPRARNLSYSFRAVDDNGATITGGSGQPFIVASSGGRA